ncbi:cation/multidrug efflux pump [Pyrinomonas methylaliphatogenes]|uniref:Cation/multidrug efflux pump n=2 Tax=Pyrinomonas methylaliphatogenes TaxID=454194 RepID=A0A0B6WSN0_9BACT|nr:cation/multidrug efflux pump [Pyrinomonas methylaliphatogenes]
MNPMSFIIKQERAVLVLALLLCAAGLLAAWRLPSALFPQTDFPRIIIILDDGVVPAQQMLVSVTRPVEEAMKGIPGIVRIKSATGRGSCEINLFFAWNVDMVQALQLVQARLSQLLTTLPPTVSVRRVERLTFAVFPIMGYSLTSTARDPAFLRDLAVYTIKPQLARLPGVADVQIVGGDVREYHVVLDPERLNAHGLTPQQVADAIKRSSLIASPGLVEENHQLQLVLINGQPATPDQIGSIVIANANNAPVTVADVADVRASAEPKYTIVTADGQPAVLLNILRQPDANIVAVADAVKAALEKARAQLPKDVKITPFYDQSLLVRDAMKSVRDAIILGLILSALVIYGFLRDWRTTLIAAMVIPVTVLVAFLAMYLVGLSFDLMTLGGVAAAIGLVIDDAIVVVENIHTHLARGQTKRQAIEQALAEIAAPITGSTITPVVVFLPLSLLSGVTGVFFRSLALTMAVALLTSLALALSLTPALARIFVRSHDEREEGEIEDHKPKGELSDEPVEGSADGRLWRTALDGYERLLNWALAHRSAVAILSLAIVLGALFLYRATGSEFLPEFDESAFVLDYVAPPGTSLAETDRMLRHVEQMLRETPEVESYSRRTGLQLGLAITEPNTGDFLVKLKPDHARPTSEVIDDLRQQIEQSEPALRVEFVGILSDLIGDLTSSPAPIEIRLFGEDPAALHQTARRIEEAIKSVPGVVDTFNGVIVSGPAITFRIDSARAAKLGVDATEVANAITIAMSGDAATNVLQQDRVLPVRVIMPETARHSLDFLRNLLVRSSATGALFRLDQVADLEYDPGQAEIARDGLRQSVAVTARLSGTDLGTAIARIKERLAKEVILPPSVEMEFGGLYREQQESFRELLITLVLATSLVFLVLLIEFHSFVHPTAIVIGAVLALSGALAALFLTKMTLNVVSLMGIIMVVGIVAKNGILLLDAADERRARGDALKDALLYAGRRRLRPVLMTSLAAMLGLLPLALAIGAGASLLQPLAIAVMGGLAIGFFFSLVVTPTVYAVLEEEKN